MKLIANETKVCERENQRNNALQFSLTEKKRKKEKPKTKQEGTFMIKSQILTSQMLCLKLHLETMSLSVLFLKNPF